MFDWGYSTSEALRHAIRSLKRSLSIISSCSVIVRVSVVLKRTVGDSD